MIKLWFDIAMRIRLFAILTGILVSGCIAQDLPATGTTPPPAETALVSGPQTSPVMPTLVSGMEDLVVKAKEDLAQRLAILASQIILVEAKAVVWPDSSMGCPQPGMAYLQVPEDGAQIILEVDGSQYSYHNGGSLGLFLCELVYKDPNTPPQIDITTLTPIIPSKINPTPALPDNSIPPGEDQ